MTNQNLKEIRNFDHLTDGINSSTQIGKAYTNSIYSLANLMEELDVFNSNFSTTLKRHGINQKLNTESYIQQLEQCIKNLEQIYQPIRLMAKIESLD